MQLFVLDEYLSDSDNLYLIHFRCRVNREHHTKTQTSDLDNLVRASIVDKV